MCSSHGLYQCGLYHLPFVLFVTCCYCRRAVPLALALLNVSAPDISAMDTLSRLSHDADSEVAQAAVLGLGVLGAGV